MKRYDMQVARIKHDCGESFVANMVEVAEGRYAEYEEANARIAELTAEVARLRGLVKDAYEEGANDGYDEAVSGERGHGDRHAEWEASEAYKEVVRLEFPECSGDEISCPENEGYGCCIARNALKEGV